MYNLFEFDVVSSDNCLNYYSLIEKNIIVVIVYVEIKNMYLL